jgi:hypothetical protein
MNFSLKWVVVKYNVPLPFSLQCNFRSMAPFTPGFTVSLGQFGQSSVAFRRSATPAKRKIGPDCVPQEVGGLAGRLRAAWRACQAQVRH